MSDLKPCPFCGSANLATGGDDKFVGVWCRDCQATGPNHYGRYEWNARALIDTTAERDALRDRVAKLEAALALYSCEDGCNDCPEHERDRVTCGWTALTALQKDTPNG